MDEELMDIYDENKNLTGRTIYRKDRNILNEDEYVITSHCFIINSSDKILLTQRSLNTNRGGKWEDTHGGVRAKETSIEGIIRELKEEKRYRGKIEKHLPGTPYKPLLIATFSYLLVLYSMLFYTLYCNLFIYFDW